MIGNVTYRRVFHLRTTLSRNLDTETPTQSKPYKVVVLSKAEWCADECVDHGPFDCTVILSVTKSFPLFLLSPFFCFGKWSFDFI